MSNKAIFLDRDDTLIEDPGYISSPDQVKLLDGVAEALTELKHMGYKLIVASNQSGVARGIVSEQVLGEIHDRLKQLLAEKGASLDRIYYCPYHPDGVVAKYSKESDWRKPNPGMLLAAADEMDIELSESWVIGNSSRDIEAGLRAGCKTILIDYSSKNKQPKRGEPIPDYKAVNIKEAANIIKKYHRCPHEPAGQTNRPASQQTTEQLYQSQATAGGERTEQLLHTILEYLKSTHRAEMFGEFSITRLMAGLVQILVLFCLLISIWLLLRPTSKDNSALIALGFAMVFQMMSLTFYIMQGRK